MNSEITKLYQDDQADRKNKNWADPKFLEELQTHDRERYKIAKGLISQNVLEHADAEDHYHLAFIFQHGENIEDYKLAHDLAVTAMEMGHPFAPRMVANTLDRYLTHTNPNHMQKYGTQSHWDNDKQEYILYPVDPNTTDEEREKLDVPSLLELIKEVRNQTKILRK